MSKWVWKCLLGGSANLPLVQLRGEDIAKVQVMLPRLSETGSGIV